uniref:Thaumatin-like protein n=1 Tax=Brassica campestris TaxID=3711 RepID=M4DFD9_BRACM
MAHRIVLFVILLVSLSEVEPVSFKITNRCRNTIWPGFLSGATSPPLPTTGFRLSRGKSKSVTIPASWSGRLWARTLCSQDPSSGSFSCLTADCGSGKVECSGSGAKL